MMNEGEEEPFDYCISEGEMTLDTAVGLLQLWFVKGAGLPPFFISHSNFW
jgi:hypothetical protein